jgi:hypothetical protein
VANMIKGKTPEQIREMFNVGRERNEPQTRVERVIALVNVAKHCTMCLELCQTRHLGVRCVC